MRAVLLSALYGAVTMQSLLAVLDGHGRSPKSRPQCCVDSVLCITRLMPARERKCAQPGKASAGQMPGVGVVPRQQVHGRLGHSPDNVLAFDTATSHRGAVGAATTGAVHTQSRVLLLQDIVPAVLRQRDGSLLLSRILGKAGSLLPHLVVDTLTTQPRADGA